MLSRKRKIACTLRYSRLYDNENCTVKFLRNQDGLLFKLRRVYSKRGIEIDNGEKITTKKTCFEIIHLLTLAYYVNREHRPYITIATCAIRRFEPFLYLHLQRNLRPYTRQSCAANGGEYILPSENETVQKEIQNCTHRESLSHFRPSATATLSDEFLKKVYNLNKNECFQTYFVFSTVMTRYIFCLSPSLHNSSDFSKMFTFFFFARTRREAQRDFSDFTPFGQREKLLQ